MAANVKKWFIECFYGEDSDFKILCPTHRKYISNEYRKSKECRKGNEYRKSNECIPFQDCYSEG